MARHMLWTLALTTPMISFCRSTAPRTVLDQFLGDQTQSAVRDARLYYPNDQFWAIGRVFNSLTLALTTARIMSEQFSPIIAVFDGATIGFTAA